MMALKPYYKEDIAQTILAGLVLAVQTARACGDNTEYLEGALSAFQHQAHTFGVSWPGVIADARASLGSDLAELLDGAHLIQK
jgi:hypothetical protein